MNIDELSLSPFCFGGSNEPDQTLAIAAEMSSGNIQHGVWQCGPGELTIRFKWCETVFITEGSAEVENLHTGQTHTLRVGSMMSFEQNSLWRWRIPWKLKKVFTLIDLPK